MRRSCFALAGVLVMGAALLVAAPVFATTPGHNGRILFGAVTAEGSSQLFLTGPHGHGAHQITYVNSDAVHPDWYPNVRRIAFDFDPQNVCSIVAVRANVSHQRTLPHLPGAESDEQPPFTPAG